MITVETIEENFKKYEGECTLQTYGYQQMSPHECARLCQMDINCFGFSYNFNPKSDYPCFRKRDVCKLRDIVIRQTDPFRTYVKKVMNEYRSAKGNLFMIKRGDCPGGDLGSEVHPTPNIDTCCSNYITF